MTSAAPHPGGRPEPAIKANAAPGTLFTTGRLCAFWPFAANRQATPVVSGARARRSPSHPLGSESSGLVALKDVCKPRTQILSLPAPLFPLASDGRPRTLSDCAGGAKMHVRQTHAGRARTARVSYAKQSQAVTLFPSSGRSSPCGLDATGPEAAHFLLRNLRAFFPFNAGNRIVSQPAHVRQDPPRCMTDVFEALRGFVSAAAFHGSNETMERHEACSKNPTMRFTA